jgi:hypothetical protein
MVMEAKKVEGYGFPQFVYTQYNQLNDAQKQSLFRALGQLSLLDILVGNDDRLMRAEDFNEPTYIKHGPEQPNLDNLMVEKDSFLVYGIDNVSNPKYCEERETYLNFLNTVLSPSIFVHLSKNIQASITLFFKFTDTPPANATEKEALKSFIKDFQAIGAAPIQQGLEEMYGHFIGTILPAWKSDRATEIKTLLNQLDPSFIAMIDERFDAASQRSISSAALTREGPTPLDGDDPLNRSFRE